MKVKEFLQNHLYHFFCVVLLYNIIGFYIRDYYGLSAPKIIILLLSAIWVLILHMFDQYKKTPIPYLILGIIVIISVFFAIRYNKSLNEVTNSYLHWLNNIVYGEDTASVGEGITLAYSLLSFCIVNLLCFPLYLVSKIRVGRFVLAILCAIIAIIMIITEYDVDKSVSAFFFAYFFLCLIEFSITKQIKAAPKESQSITTFLTPFAAILLILCCLLTTSKEPMKYTLIKNIWATIERCREAISIEITNWLDPPTNHEFGVAFAGFNGDGVINNEVKGNDNVALTVKDINPKATNIYLIGNIKNEFKGKEWINTLKKDEFLSEYKESELQLYELMNAVSRYYLSIYEQQILDRRRVEITYNDQSTKSVFSQAYSLSLDKEKNVPKIIQKDGHIEFAKIPKRDPKYEVNALQLRLGTDLTNQFLITRTKYPYMWSAMDSIGIRHNINYFNTDHFITPIDNIQEVLMYRANYIKENYCTLPENLSENVINLSQEITKNGESTYEKLKLLEAYLNTYKYTTHPKPLPEDKDFLEYFLFESKEGYCTYFATSMTIMARCIGIPTRYVQGYCIETKDKQFSYLVTGNDAHAWVEAYLEGVGWIPFEPTAGYEKSLYRAREAYPTITNTNSSSTYQIQKPEVPQNYTEPEIVAIKTEETLTKTKTYLYALGIVLGVTLLTILLTVAYFYINIRFSKASYRKASTEKKLYILLQRILFLISRYGLCHEDNPTLLRQFVSLYENADFDEQTTMEVATKYMQLCYGDRTLEETDEHRIVAFYQDLLLYGKKRFNTFEYYLLILRLAKIKDSRS